MRKTADVEVAGQRVPVMELTATQVDEIFSSMEKGFEMSRLDQLMMVQMHIPEFAIDMMTAPIKLAEVVAEHDLAPSEYAHVYEKAQEVNNFLSQALQMYREKQERVANMQSALSTMVG